MRANLNPISIWKAFATLLFFASASIPSWAQLEFGFGTSWDYGIAMPNHTGYTPYGKGQTSLATFDGYIRIPVTRRIAIYPTLQYSIPTHSILLENSKGEYIPAGYQVSLPYDESENFSLTWVSDDYFTLTSKADVWQKSAGAFLMLDLGSGLEIGTGIFLRKKECRIYDFMAYDEYWYYNSTGNETDNYIFDRTYEYSLPANVRVIRETLPAIPLLFQYTQYFDGFLYMGGSFIYWTAMEDPYMSFRYTMGLTF